MVQCSIKGIEMDNLLKKLNLVWQKVCQGLNRDSSSMAYERYLSQATDVHNLEVREREWSRNQQHQNMF